MQMQAALARGTCLQDVALHDPGLHGMQRHSRCSGLRELVEQRVRQRGGQLEDLLPWSCTASV